jgi:hypothetical protein
LRRLLVEFTASKLGEDARFFAGTLETAQGGIEILVLANTNAGHSNLKVKAKEPPAFGDRGRILKCGPAKGKGSASAPSNGSR